MPLNEKFMQFKSAKPLWMLFPLSGALSLWRGLPSSPLEVTTQESFPNPSISPVSLPLYSPKACFLAHCFRLSQGFRGGLNSKESSCNAGDLGSVPGLIRSPGVGHSNPLQYSCLENPHRQRSLGGYSPWGHKELDTTK